MGRSGGDSNCGYDGMSGKIEMEVDRPCGKGYFKMTKGFDTVEVMRVREEC